MWIFLNFPMVILSVEVKNKSIYWKNQIFHCPPTIFHWWKIFLPSKFRLVLICTIPHLNCNQIASYSQLPLPDLNLLGKNSKNFLQLFVGRRALVRTLTQYFKNESLNLSDPQNQLKREHAAYRGDKTWLSCSNFMAFVAIPVISKN